MNITRFAGKAFAIASLSLLPFAAQATPVLTLILDDDALINGSAGETTVTLFTGATAGGVAYTTMPAISFRGLNFTISGEAQDFGSFDKVTELSVTSNGAGDAWVTLIVSNLSQGNAATATTSITPTVVGGTLDFFSTVDGVAVGSFLGLDGGDVATASVTVDPLSNPYEIVHRFFVSHDAETDQTTFDATTVVPAPGVLAVLGLGLLGFGFAGRRRKHG